MKFLFRKPAAPVPPAVSALGTGAEDAATAGPVVPLRSVVLHVGGPKTATSTLQRWMNSNRPALGAEGVQVLSPKNLRSGPMLGPALAFLQGRRDLPPREILREPFAAATRPRMLVSEESLTNQFIPGQVSPGVAGAPTGFAGVERLVALIRAMDLPDLQILLTVRRQDRFIRSCYSHRIKRSGATEDFAGWLAAHVDAADLSWARVTRALEAAFGEDRVHVVPYEILEDADDAALYARCLAPLGVDTSGHRAPKIRNANPALSELTVDLARRLNALPARTAAQAEFRTTTIESIHRFCSDAGDPVFRPDMRAFTDTCRALYATENAELARRKFPDLATSFDYSRD